MQYLDIDKLDKTIFSNPKYFSELSRFLDAYKIIGWGEAFDKLLKGGHVAFNAEVVADFIQYFGLSYEELQDSIQKGKIDSMSVTALLDLAFGYSTESKKYSIIFGFEDLKYLITNPGPNSAPEQTTKEMRINEALRLVKVIRKRTKVTVPPVDKDFTLKNGKNRKKEAKKNKCYSSNNG